MDKIVHSFEGCPPFSVTLIEEEIDEESVTGNKSIVRCEFEPDNIDEFLSWCGDESEAQRLRENYEYSGEDVVSGYINHAYPRVNFEEGVVFLVNGGLHYVCQHSFDILPKEIKDKFYQSRPVFEGEEILDIGHLYTLEDEKFLIKSSDIHDGFMLTKEQIDKIGTFSDWIRKRNEERD